MKALPKSGGARAATAGAFAVATAALLRLLWRRHRVDAPDAGTSTEAAAREGSS